MVLVVCSKVWGFVMDFGASVFDRVALAYGWIVFLGFAIIPISVMTGLLKKDPTGGLTMQIEETAAITGVF